MEELERRCWGGVVCFAARGELTCVVSSSRGGAWLWLFAVLGFPIEGASYLEMLATSVACFYLAAGL